MAGHPPFPAMPKAPWPAPRWRTSTVLVALAPLLSCGLLAFFPAAVLAVLRRRKADWAVLAVVACMSCAEMILVELVPDNSPGSPWVGALALVTMGAPILHFFLVVRAGQRAAMAIQPFPYYPQSYPYQQQYPQPQPYPPSYPQQYPYAAPQDPYAYPVYPADPALPAVPAPGPGPAAPAPASPATEDVGAELRRLSERLRGPQEGPR
jgi:hypothetical protein